MDKKDITLDKVTQSNEVISPEAYNAIIKENIRLKAAFNKALAIIANNYAENVAQSILADVDKNSNK